MSVLLGDRGRLRRLLRPPRKSRRHALRGVAGSARETAGVQAADGLELPLGVFVRQRLQLRLPGGAHQGAVAVGSRRVQRPRDGRAGAGGRRGESNARRDRVERWNGLADVQARRARREGIRARGWRRIPHLLGVRARAGRPLGHVPVGRPRATRSQRDRLLVAPPRRVRQPVVNPNIKLIAFTTIILVSKPSPGLGTAVPLGRGSVTVRGSTMSLQRERTFILALLLILAAASWAVLIWQSRTANTMGMGLTMGMGAALFLAIWVVMMIAMMFPTTAPMNLVFARVQRDRHNGRRSSVSTWIFVGAYLLIWTLFGVLAYLGALTASGLAQQVPWIMLNAARIGGGTFMLAGLYQFAPLKRVCLAKCCTPLDFIPGS